MATPTFYATITPLAGGMNVLLWVPNEGSTYKTSLTALADYVLSQVGTQLDMTPTTVAQLEAPTTAGAGARSFVTDATATTFNSVVAGGGSDKVPVFCDGSDWRIG